MAYRYLVASCAACGQLVTCNPDRVPSLRLTRDAAGHPSPDPNGQREPLCQCCARRWCALHGKDPAAVIPDGAYQPGPAECDDYDPHYQE